MTTIKGETSVDFDGGNIKIEGLECEAEDTNNEGEMGQKVESDLNKIKVDDDIGMEIQLGTVETDNIKLGPDSIKEKEVNDSDFVESEHQPPKRLCKRKLSVTNGDNESVGASNSSSVWEDVKAVEEALGSEYDEEEEVENKPRRRGRCKKNPDIIPSHLSSDIVLGYKILLKFLETPQFSGFHKPFSGNTGSEDSQITCLNQIKKKFEDNSYSKVCDFVNDVREMLTNIYESRNTVAIKRALRLEQVLEQRIAQLPNYLRPQCALVLSPEEVNNSHNKIRINKGGGFVSLLLEKAEKRRSEKDKEKRKMLAEERKQLKEEQDKDVQEWEKNVLLKDFEEEIKSMWELPAIGQFIHLCTDVLNIGEVAQFEVERMLLMPQCSDTLDLIMTSLLTNSLVRAKLDRTPSMPYSIWSPLVRTRVLSWYRLWHREGRNEQKLFEEIGIEPEFWQIVGSEVNPLDYYYFHEISLLQRVWILKTLCDVDLVRKKTVHDNLRAQTLDELNPVHLGVDRHGNRYIYVKQFCGSDVRIYRQSTTLEGDISPSELIESVEGFEHREGPITADKVFRDIWELNDKPPVRVKKKKPAKAKRARSYSKVVPTPTGEKKNLRQSARAKQKTYVDWSDSDLSDTDLATLKNKLTTPDTETLYRPFSDKEFISLSVFRLPRDKVNKPTSKRSNYVPKRNDESNRNDGTANDKNSKFKSEDNKEDIKTSVCEDEQTTDSLGTAKQVGDSQTDLEKTFQGDDMNGDEFDLEEKISNCKLDKVNSDVKFTVKNLENLKMVFKKGSTGENEISDKDLSDKSDLATGEDSQTEEKENSLEKQYAALYKHNVPDHLKPDSSKFYLVVDSVEGLRQLISKFGSHENDLEIITRNTKSKKKNSQSNTSCEVQLIERLQSLLAELEPWELDLMKSCRSNREKMYKEYMSFVNRPTDFVHPNESYWMKTYEEPASTTATTTTTTTTVTTTAADGNSSTDKTGGKDAGANPGESADVTQQDNALEELAPRKRTRVTKMQFVPQGDDLDADFEDGEDNESNESDDNWVLPTPKRRTKRETPTRASKLPRRSTGRKAKSSPFEKTDSHASTGEKSHSSSPEKAKKALFWGPRSSDPSEDLNWETNRQKILEQHNSPTKKVIFKSDDIMDDIADLENALHHSKPESSSTSVITASPKRFATPIPGNKKPYFSSAQLKAMENQAKQDKTEEGQTIQQKIIIDNSSGGKINSAKTELIATSSNAATEFVTVDSGSKAPVKIQTYSRMNKTSLNKSTLVRSPQTINRPRQPAPKQVVAVVGSRIDATSTNFQQPVKYAPQIKGQIQRPVTPVQMANQVIQNVEVQHVDSSGGVIQQKSVGQVQIQQPNQVQQIQIQQPNQVQQIQIQQPSGQISQNWVIATSVANVRMQQPVQWQPKVITVQSLGQPGKIIQQQVQPQSQVPIQGHPQVQLQNQTQVQGQIQQVIHLEPQKLTTAQQQQQPNQASTEKVVQQRIITQPQTSASSSDTDNELYITDGKHFVKFDSSAVQQFVQKDSSVQRILTLNLNDKLDLKKPLFIVKPKKTTNVSTSQQNILVINKPTTVQQTAVSSSVPEFVIPRTYILKDENQVQPQGEQQTVKIVQQTPTYVIQQKPIGNKVSQSPIFKILTSQPMGTNQNLILSPASISVSAQEVIRPVNQTVIASDQETKSTTSTLRFIRPQITTSTSPNIVQSKINTVQGPVIVNNIVEIQGSRVDSSKPQNSVVTGRIVSSVPVATAQSQTAVPTANLTPQPVRSAINVQQVRMASSVQPQQVKCQTVASPAILNSQPVRLANINVQGVRMTTSVQSQPVQTQTVVSVSNLNPQTVRTTSNTNAQQVRVANVHPQQLQTHTVVPVANFNPQAGRLTSGVNLQQVRMATNAQSQMQTQTLVTTGNYNSQTVRLPTNINTQQVRTATSGQTHISSVNSQTVRSATNTNPSSGKQPQDARIVTSSGEEDRFIIRNVTNQAAVVTSSIQPPRVVVSSFKSPETILRPVQLQSSMNPAGAKPARTKYQLEAAKNKKKRNTLSNAPIIITLDEDDDEIKVVDEIITVPSVDYLYGELSVKKTSRGWLYAVKDSDGEDFILTDEQVEERRKIYNGNMM